MSGGNEIRTTDPLRALQQAREIIWLATTRIRWRLAFGSAEFKFVTRVDEVVSENISQVNSHPG